jgi:uncharacterized membrane protein YgaE (UPF0421/DUF939 family)
MNAVLMTHFLIEKRMDFPLIINEIALLFIGMGLGILLNLIMPRYREKIREEQVNLEEIMKLTLRGMGNMLQEKDACLVQGESILNESERTPKVREYKQQEYQLIPSKREKEIINNISTTFECVEFAQLDNLLEELLKKAYDDAGNTLLSDTRYLVSYLEMRKLQIGVLKDIKENIEHIPVLLRQTYPIVEFMEHTASSFHELNNAEGLLSELAELQEHFRKEKLPETREEFEYRAILFQILKELEYFLLLKRNFMQELEAKNMKSYWTR